MERKVISISRHMLYKSVALGALCVLTLLFSACEKDLIGKGTGKKVAVNISLNSSDYADAPRSLNARMSEPETVEVTLGRDDGVYMRATLAETPIDEPDAGKLRATVNLAENQKVCLAAFLSGTSTPEGSTADYVYSGGSLNPAGPSGPLLVDEDLSYEIVAYSYYNDITNYPVTTNINSANQLLWGKSAAKTITQADHTVSITMAQKFAQVKVSISTANLPSTPNITAISNVSIASESAPCNLTVYNGNLTTGTPATQTVAFSTLNSSAIVSTPRTIYPVAAGAKTTITIGSITINGTPYTDLTAIFTKELLGGHNYTLTVDLNKANVILAGSNIYWDGSKMTFEPAGYVGEKSFYQGLLFKWGSLVGIGKTFSTSTRIYYPVNAGTWSADGATMATLSYSSWSGIQAMPFGSVDVGISGDRITSYGFDYTTKLGDICRRINSNYRMPRGNEIAYNLFGGLWTYLDIPIRKGTDADGNTIPIISFGAPLWGGEDGTMMMDYARNGTREGFIVYQGVILPITGRLESGGTLPGSVIPGEGYYWSSSFGGEYPLYLKFTNDGAGMTFSLEQDIVTAAPIRCIKN